MVKTTCGRSVYKKTLQNYGHIKLCLRKKLAELKMSPYHLSKLTDINYGIILKYCNDKLYRVDLDVLSKICYVLKCKLSDILIYDYDIPRKKHEKNKKKSGNNRDYY